MHKFNNIVTKCFGNPAWYIMEIFAMGYPLKNPTRKQRNDYRRFYYSFANTLPCNLCRDSFKVFLRETPIKLSGRKELVFWVFKLHNRVNRKLKCKEFTKVQMEKKYKWYEKFRAKNCNKNLGGCTKGRKIIRKCAKVKFL